MSLMPMKARALTAPPLTYEKWIEGYKAGRTFVSNGPLLSLKVDGNEARRAFSLLLDPPLTYEKWIEGYKAGRTFVSNGPLLSLKVDGNEPGAEIHLPVPGTVRVSAAAVSNVPMDVLEPVVNGEVAAQVKRSGDGTSLEMEQVLPLEKSSWVAARVWGPPHRFVMNDPHVFAHTSPVYVYVGDQKITVTKDAEILVAWIDRLIRDVAESPRFATEARRKEVLALFKRGRRYYEEISGRQ